MGRFSEKCIGVIIRTPQEVEWSPFCRMLSWSIYKGSDDKLFSSSYSERRTVEFNHVPNFINENISDYCLILRDTLLSGFLMKYPIHFN